MSDIDTVIEGSRVLKQLLEIRFGATGRGLHQKINSIGATVLPMKTVKRLRWIATMRNKVVHENFSLPDRDAFILSCNLCRNEIINVKTTNNGIVNKITSKLKYILIRSVFIIIICFVTIIMYNVF